MYRSCGANRSVNVSEYFDTYSGESIDGVFAGQMESPEISGNSEKAADIAVCVWNGFN